MAYPCSFFDRLLLPHYDGCTLLLISSVLFFRKARTVVGSSNWTSFGCESTAVLFVSN